MHMYVKRKKKEDEEYVPGQSGYTHVQYGPKRHSDSGQGTTDQQGHDSTQGTTEQQEADLTPGRDVGKWLHAEKMKKKMLNDQ